MVISGIFLRETFPRACMARFPSFPKFLTRSSNSRSFMSRRLVVFGRAGLENCWTFRVPFLRWHKSFRFWVQESPSDNCDLLRESLYTHFDISRTIWRITPLAIPESARLPGASLTPRIPLFLKLAAYRSTRPR